MQTYKQRLATLFKICSHLLRQQGEKARVIYKSGNAKSSILNSLNTFTDISLTRELNQIREVLHNLMNKLTEIFIL